MILAKSLLKEYKMHKIIPEQIINVQAYKHDGTLYRQWNGVKVLEVSSFNVVLFMFKTKVAELSGQKWIIREPIIWYMPLDRWFNTTCLIRNVGTYFYTNISSPPVFEDKTIKFIDYDLDIKSYPMKKTRTVDVKEYEHNSRKYKYSSKLKKIIENTVHEVKEIINKKDEFFNNEVIMSYLEDLIDLRLLPKKYLSLLKNLSKSKEKS